MIRIPNIVIAEIQKNIGVEENPEFIDAGGFKAVYKINLGDKLEALKIIPLPEVEEEEKTDNIKRIEREIDIIRNCSSKNIVKLGRIDPVVVEIERNTYFYYSEELLTGESISKKMKDGHKPCYDELKELYLNILDVIDELWSGMEHQVIHRDIKPNNIIETCDPERRYILLDLGIAFIKDETGITRDSVAIPGTLYYLAPEMLKAGFRKNLDYRADLYALGLTIYEYATGQNPFAIRGDGEYNTMSRIAEQTPEKLSIKRDDLPRVFCDTIDQLIKKVPALRPSNIKILRKIVGE